MFENFKLCPNLDVKKVCIVVEEYDRGKFFRKFHYHMPKSRLNGSDEAYLLRSLVTHFSHGTPEAIVESYFNKRGNQPWSAQDLLIQVTYPEPGVLRKYCGTNTRAWLDRVIIEAKFRNSQT